MSRVVTRDIDLLDTFGSIDLYGRQPYPKLSVAGLRIKIDSAVVVEHQAADDIEPEAGSVSLWFGCKEGVEDAAANILRDPWDPLESTCRHASLSIL